MRRYLPWTGLLLVGVTMISSSHDDTQGARFVDPDGANASDCLEHHEPCRSIQYALAQAVPGNTIKVATGIYDMSGVEPENFLFGVIRAQGGYEGGHFEIQDPDANPTILLGVDSSYRQQMMHLGFKWAADLASALQGIVDESPAPALQATAIAAMPCVQGFAGQFPCRNVDLMAQIPLNQFTSTPVSAANVWGLVDLNDNREYAVVGLSNGTAIVEVTDPANARQVDFVPGNSSSWREVKIYQQFDAVANRYRAYAYITTEAASTGLQVIDLSGLPNSVSLATTLVDTGSQHTDYVSNIDYSTNVALPGATAYLYVAGSNVGGGSWRVYSLADPAQPQFMRQAPGAGYMHDSTSMLITDQRTTQCAPGHDPCEVLVDFNVSTVDLWDVTDKAAPVLLSSTTYSDASYTHSGWPTADQRHIFVHDELEEIRRGVFTQIYTMNVDDLRNPFIQASYQGPDTTTDHNGYVKGSLLYVSHYRRGLVVFDASNPAQLRELSHFDTFLAPAANSAGTDGAWGVYPFFPSGTVVISDINNGLFVLRDHTATLSQSAGRIGFVGTAVSVGENAGLAQVRVRRNVGFAGAVSIQYATSDGTAMAGGDYTTVSGTLNWAAGELDERTITLPLVNDAASEGTETFRITLSNVAGGAVIDGSATFDVSITNDDVVPPPGPGNGGGGGGAIGIELPGLLGLLLLAAGGKPKTRRRAKERPDQMRLRHDGRA
jgi:choice-of-anchor B domain-containing protein